MPIAPHVAAWGGRWPSMAAGPLAGESIGGLPFRLAPILAQYPLARLVVEAAFGADLQADPDSWSWTDITSDVRQADRQTINISPMGRSDETGTSQPAGCTFQLRNTSGDYTAYRTASRFHPFVRRNTPIKVTVNLTGAPNDNSVRFQGYANGWRPWWDDSARCAVVTVSASGQLRRLQQGRAPLKSALYRALPDTDPTAYWPLEGSAPQSGLAGGTTMTTIGQIQYATESGHPASGPLANLTGGGKFYAPLPDGSVSNQWRVEFVARFGTGSDTIGNADFTVPVQLFSPSGTVNIWEVLITTGTATLQWSDISGSYSDLLATTIEVDDGQWHHFRIDAAQNGGNIDASLTVDGTLGGTSSLAGKTLNSTGSSIAVNPNQDIASFVGSVGHLTYWAPFASTVDTHYVATGYAGELATVRLARLCAEEGIPLDIVGTSDTAMGAQGIDTLINLIRQCETADHGLLYDGRGPGLGYVARSEVFNQSAMLTVDATAGQIFGSFEPADDDQRSRNKVTATVSGGTDGFSATYEDSTGPLGTAAIGVYESSITVNINTNAEVGQHAAWTVHEGTVEGFRYPTLSLDLAGGAPELAATWAALRLLGRIDVTNISSRATQHPDGTVSQIAEGWGERLSPFIWQATVNSSPYSPWIVGTIETSGFIDCAATVLAEELDTTETGVDIVVTDECVWAHDNGDYVIVIDDEEMTVTAVSAAVGSFPSRTQTFTVTRSINGVVAPHSISSSVHVRDPFVLAL